MLPEENKQFIEDKSLPLWARILNLDASRWERSKYAAPQSPDSEGTHRLKDLNLVRQIAPEMYEMAESEAKEFRDNAVKHNGTWKKVGSIPIMDMSLHPELRYDKFAQDKYFSEHPELKA